jgi:hypothetical protein
MFHEFPAAERVISPGVYQAWIVIPMLHNPFPTSLHRAVITCGILLLLAGLLVFPSAARTDIQTIQNGDKIFIYEQNLDITALRTGANPVTSLRKYRDDNPTQGLIREVPVPDDTSFSLIPEAFADQLEIYYGFNPTDGAMGSVVVNVPSVSLDVVLASPNHSDSIMGLSVSPKTPVAFKITSVDVGSSYRAGSLYPATVDVVLTTPGGGQLTTIQGKDFSRMNVSSQVFYTDDPGRPGAITFEGLDAGTYAVQVKWRDPASFDQQAPDSNTYSFGIGSPAPATTVQPATTMATPRTTAVTPAPATLTSPPTTVPPPETTPLPPTTPPATPTPSGTPAPSPTPTPMGAWPALLAPALALLPFLRSRKNR